MSGRPGGFESWLATNRSLRLDANSDLFPADRREFHIDRYEFAKRYCGDKRVLDGACGTGYGSVILGTVAKQVIGIDCAPDAIEYAAQCYATSNVSFRRSFVELTPFESSSFDAVVSFETIEHTLCPGAHMMEIARLLKPKDGIAIISVPNRWGYTDHHFFDFDLPRLQQITARNFEKTELFCQNPRSHASLPGIAPFVSDGTDRAQCIIAVCSDPRKEHVSNEPLHSVMHEIYQNVFARHQEFLALTYRQNTNLVQRAINRLRSMWR